MTRYRIACKARIVTVYVRVVRTAVVPATIIVCARVARMISAQAGRIDCSLILMKPSESAS
jgi:hypothetical protein